MKSRKVLAVVVALMFSFCIGSVAFAADSGGTQPMYRLYNPNSGEHFYTASAGERDSISRVGWRYEGIGWTAPKKSNTPVYRLYNPNAGDHHYTTSKGERDVLVSVGWRYEGIGWYSSDAKSVALLRQYNPNAKAGAHNFTTSAAENNMLVSVGWRAEGIGWYGVNTTKPSSSSTGSTTTTSTTTTKESTYTIKYNANGGTGSMADQKLTWAPTKLSANTFTRTGYKFAGWKVTIDGIVYKYSDKATVTALTFYGKTLTFYAQWEKTDAATPTTKTYTVTFKDGLDGKTIKTEKVVSGKSATAPAAPTHTGYTFVKWDKAYNKVTSNLTVTATYKINTYIVTFKDGVDGKTITTQTVNYGASAKAPAAPAHSGYTFTKWDKAFSKVTGNMTVTAVYTKSSTPTPATYTVTFKDGVDGKTLKTEKVTSGKSATAPTPPAHTGYTFSKWDKTYSKVTSNLTVTATYKINTYTVTFKDGVDGKTISTQKVNYGASAKAPASPVHSGYTFTKWDKAYNKVTSNLTVTAVYTKDAPKTFKVTHYIALSNDAFSDNIYAHGKIMEHFDRKTNTFPLQQTVSEGNSATIINDEIINEYGSVYRLLGSYAVSASTGKKVNTSSINQDTNIIYVLKDDYWAWRQQWIRDNLDPSMTELQKVARIVYMMDTSYDYGQPGVGFPVWSWIKDYPAQGRRMWVAGKGVCQDAHGMLGDFLDDLGIKWESYRPWQTHIMNRVWIDGEIWTVDATPFSDRVSGGWIAQTGYLEELNKDQYNAWNDYHSGDLPSWIGTKQIITLF